MTASTPLMTFRNLCLGYGHPLQALVLADTLQETVRSQELVALIGPNGAGKSTLLRTMARMQPPLRGEIRLLGEDMARMSPKEIARKLSVVLTDRADVGYIQAADVVAMGRFPHTGWLGILSSADRRKIDQAIAQTGIESLLSKPLYQLSDGERQKVMIARALAQDTPLMLLDEPTTHLDIANRVSIMQLLKSLVQKARKTIVHSTHDVELALQVSDRLWLMHDQNISSGTPEDLVLNGTLSRVMGNEHTPFDTQSGTFRIRQAGRQAVSLHGSGVQALWTRRALERVGYQLQNSAPMSIHVGEERGVWQLRRREKTIRCHSIEELLSELSKSSQLPTIQPYES